MMLAIEPLTQGKRRERSAGEWRGVMVNRQARTEAAAWEYLSS